MKNFYAILGVKPQATADEIKRAYFVLAKKTHPDSGNQAEVKRFYEVSEAYEILSDSEKRHAYDLRQTSQIHAESSEDGGHRPVSFCRETHSASDNAFHQKEMHVYRRQLFFKAVFRVILVTICFAFFGIALSAIFAGSRVIGIVAGVAFGFFLAVNGSFDLATFFPDSTQQKLVTYATYVIMIMSMGYFIFLFAYHLFQ
ncbi:hypothetical protein COY07_02595 [Candidatus Peregrinibacteria bacterium CG_4_10_14_0_2_um_filter_43_11]|nr:MAG: hypothetical protein COY07_02595 [Candidatus Peregrinibacteria bacterium CG_4_10_14_0_2_um_filter_43_11]